MTIIIIICVIITIIIIMLHHHLFLMLQTFSIIMSYELRVADDFINNNPIFIAMAADHISVVALLFGMSVNSLMMQHLANVISCMEMYTFWSQAN